MNVAVIGCGIFGATIALRLNGAGCKVTVHERLSAILGGASFNNQNRLHLGFHYPRDMHTAKQCARGFLRFKETFRESILEGFPNAYFIASQGSLTSPDEYLAFCEKLDLPYEITDLDGFLPRVEGVDLGLLVDEVVYDCGELRRVIGQQLAASPIELRVSVNVDSISRTHAGFVLRTGDRLEGPYDAIVNCTYSDGNRFTDQLGHNVPRRQFEYTVVPIFEWNEAPLGITIMDGPFMTVLPFGNSGRFLLYHVKHSVVAEQTGRHLDRTWLDQETSPMRRLDSEPFFHSIFESCREFVPALESARPVGFLEGPRVVIANQDDTDARPSLVESPEPGYVSVFSGKIDHCVWVADEVIETLGIL